MAKALEPALAGTMAASLVLVVNGHAGPQALRRQVFARLSVQITGQGKYDSDPGHRVGNWWGAAQLAPLGWVGGAMNQADGNFYLAAHLLVGGTITKYLLPGVNSPVWQGIN